MYVCEGEYVHPLLCLPNPGANKEAFVLLSIEFDCQSDRLGQVAHTARVV